MSSHPKRILFLDHTAEMGGGEIALLNLVRHLDRASFEPVVALFSDGPLRQRLIEAGVETHLLELDPRIAHTRKDALGIGTLLRVRQVWGAAGFVRRLTKLIRRLDIDLVHTNSLKSDLLGGAAAKLAHRPIVWHVRDRIDRDYLPSMVVLAFRALCRWVPDALIANSAATLATVHPPRRKTAQAIPSGIDLAARARVVHDGTGAEDEVRASSTADGQPRLRRIGLVGRISPWKGQHIFLRAAALVHRQFPDVNFQIIGSAMFQEENYEAELHRLTAELGLQSCVEFTGFRSNVRELIDHLEVLVHASTTGEPFGQVVIEGMAAGKPVVATNGGGIPEIVDDGVTGLLVPMGDAPAMAEAIGRLLSEPELARQMGISGRQRVRIAFTIEKTARSVEALYGSLLAGQRDAQSATVAGTIGCAGASA